MSKPIDDVLKTFRQFARHNDSDYKLDDSITPTDYQDYDKAQLDGAKQQLLADILSLDVMQDQHIQHFSFHGRSDIRDELRREIRAALQDYFMGRDVGTDKASGGGIR